MPERQPPVEPRARRLLKALGLEETPGTLTLVMGVIEEAMEDQRRFDQKICMTIAADTDGSLGEPKSDLGELARSCAVAIGAGDAGVIEHA